MFNGKLTIFLEGVFFGGLVCFAILLVYIYQPAKIANPPELTIEQAASKIKNKKVKESYLKPSQVELIDETGNKFFTNIGSDPTREQILKEISAVNENNANFIKVTEEPRSSSFFLIALMNFLPFAGMLGMLLFLVIIYNNHLKTKVEK